MEISFKLILDGVPLIRENPRLPGDRQVGVAGIWNGEEVT